MALRSGRTFHPPELNTANSGSSDLAPSLEVQSPSAPPLALTHPAMASEGFLKHVGKFDGQHWEEFCARFEKACQLAERTPKDMLLFHISDDIYRSVKRVVEHSDANWERTIKPSFKSLFGKVIDESVVIRDFHARLQGSTEPVQAYLLALRNIESDLQTPLSDDEFLKKFTSGLRYDLRLATALQPTSLNTVDAILKFAKDVESVSRGTVFPPSQSANSYAPTSGISSSSPSPPASSSASAAVHVVKPDHGRPRRAKSKPGAKCHHCGREGHKISDCRTLAAELRDAYLRKPSKDKVPRPKVRSATAMLADGSDDDE